MEVNQHVTLMTPISNAQNLSVTNETSFHIKSMRSVDASVYNESQWLAWRSMLRLMCIIISENIRPHINKIQIHSEQRVGEQLILNAHFLY